MIVKQYFVVCLSDVDGTFKDRNLKIRHAVEIRDIFKMIHYIIRNYIKYQYRKMFKMTRVDTIRVYIFNISKFEGRFV
jgi:hypothetical protein